MNPAHCHAHAVSIETRRGCFPELIGTGVAALLAMKGKNKSEIENPNSEIPQ